MTARIFLCKCTDQSSVRLRIRLHRVLSNSLIRLDLCVKSCQQCLAGFASRSNCQRSLENSSGGGSTEPDQRGSLPVYPKRQEKQCMSQGPSPSDRSNRLFDLPVAAFSIGRHELAFFYRPRFLVAWWMMSLSSLLDDEFVGYCLIVAKLCLEKRVFGKSNNKRLHEKQEIAKYTRNINENIEARNRYWKSKKTSACVANDGHHGVFHRRRVIQIFQPRESLLLKNWVVWRGRNSVYCRVRESSWISGAEGKFWKWPNWLMTATLAYCPGVWTIFLIRSLPGPG